MQLCLIAFLGVSVRVYIRTIDGAAVANAFYVFIISRVVSVRGTRWYVHSNITLWISICNGRGDIWRSQGISVAAF